MHSRLQHFLPLPFVDSGRGFWQTENQLIVGPAIVGDQPHRSIQSRVAG